MNAILCCLEPQKRYSAFFSKYETSGQGPYSYSINNGLVNCWISMTDGSASMESETEILAGTWHLITIVRDGPELRLYVDGAAGGTMDLRRHGKPGPGDHRASGAPDGF